MLAGAAALVAWPLLRGQDDPPASGAAIAIYRDQLAQLDAEQRDGALEETEARLARREINRRLLAAAQHDAQIRPALSGAASPTLAFFTALLLIAGATGLYLSLGRPDLILLGESAPPPASAAAPALADAIGQLEARLQRTPNDAEGWRLLGWARVQTGAVEAAVDAYRRAMQLAPDNAAILAALAEAITLAGDGIMTPETRELLDTALRLDPGEERARFYDALWYHQQGDIAAALERWLALIDDAEPGAPWLGSLTERVSELADAAGINIDGRLPSAAPPRGPSREAIENAANMTPEARAAMVEGMVARLETRLAEQPDNPDGWIRLIRSRLVLEQRQAAQAALNRARSALAAQPEALRRVEAAAQQAGLGEPAPP